MYEHTMRQFDVEMEALRNGVLTMGGLVETQLGRAVDALAKDDKASLADSVGADEQKINEQQIRMDEQCSQVIARRQPAAIDLRTILTITKIVNDLERIGDEAKKIAYKAGEVRAAERLGEVRLYEVVRTAQEAREMVQTALDAFARLDVEAACSVIDRDAAIDASFSAILRQLISYMMEDPRTISGALEIVFVAKSIERIGDHAKNIAEAIVHVVRGKDVRHVSPREIRDEVQQQ
jgi:phosphate transport system protein